MSHKLLGGNIRKGQMPGGMAGTTFDVKPKKHRVDSRGLIHKAASDFLAKRGFHNHVNGFEAAAYNYPRESR